VSITSTESPAATSPGDAPHEHGSRPTRHVRVAIVGTGFSGLGMAIRLQQSGIEDYVVLERAEDVGGTWRDNTYPGAACDVPSHLYSFSFAPNPNWTRTFSRQPEIRTYLRDCAERHGVMSHVLYGHEVTDARWVPEDRRWHVSTSGGEFVAEVLVSAMGPLTEPSIPSLPGLDRFHGRVFHSARWDHEHDLAGERVAVIGTGASAIQLVPRIQPRVGELQLYQRTAPWIVPRSDRPISRVERLVYRRLPFVQRAVRTGIYWWLESRALGLTRHPRLMKLAELAANLHLRRQVADPELRAKLTPDYTIGCKRILIANDYYPSLTRENARVVTEPIERIGEHSITTADGTEREVDTIIFSTGFHVTDSPFAKLIRGADGRTLEQTWSGSRAAYLGTAVAGFPNLFMIIGPNTGLGHTSMTIMIEANVEYVIDALRAMDAAGVDTVDVRPEVQSAFNDEVQSAMKHTVWTRGGCASWYLDAGGRNTTLWPSFTFRFRERTRRFRIDDYRVQARTPARTRVRA